MTDELRMADDGCTNEPVASGVWLTEDEVRDILDCLEHFDGVIEGEWGYGDRIQSQYLTEEWPIYQRLRAMFPARGGS